MEIVYTRNSIKGSNPFLSATGIPPQKRWYFFVPTIPRKGPRASEKHLFFQSFPCFAALAGLPLPAAGCEKRAGRFLAAAPLSYAPVLPPGSSPPGMYNEMIPVKARQSTPAGVLCGLSFSRDTAAAAPRRSSSKTGRAGRFLQPSFSVFTKLTLPRAFSPVTVTV